MGARGGCSVVSARDLFILYVWSGRGLMMLRLVATVVGQHHRRSDAASPDTSCPCPWLDGEEEGVEKEATDDQRMCEDNNEASSLFVEAGGNCPSPTTITEQSQVFNKQFKSPGSKSGSRRRFV